MSREIELPEACEPVSVSTPGWLIEVIDVLCKQHGFSRAGFFVTAAREKALIMMRDNPRGWKRLYIDATSNSR
jgi:hypothetical protein